MGKPKRKGHSLKLADRGDGHVHRWAPSCPCGWLGVPARRKWAQQQYAYHVHQIESQARSASRRRGANPQPGRLTPRDRLPEALR